jgi:hypothetical protein
VTRPFTELKVMFPRAGSTLDPSTPSRQESVQTHQIGPEYKGTDRIECKPYEGGNGPSIGQRGDEVVDKVLEWLRKVGM